MDEMRDVWNSFRNLLRAIDSNDYHEKRMAVQGMRDSLDRLDAYIRLDYPFKPHPAQMCFPFMEQDSGALASGGTGTPPL